MYLNVAVPTESENKAMPISSDDSSSASTQQCSSLNSIQIVIGIASMQVHLSSSLFYIIWSYWEAKIKAPIFYDFSLIVSLWQVNISLAHMMDSNKKSEKFPDALMTFSGKLNSVYSVRLGTSI